MDQCLLKQLGIRDACIVNSVQKFIVSFETLKQGDLETYKTLKSALEHGRITIMERWYDEQYRRTKI